MAGAAEVVIGNVHTFQVLFVDENNNPLAVNTPLIEVFRYDNAGVKVVLVPSTTMVVDPTELGRYLYPLTISSTNFVDGDTLYGNMTGVNPTTGDLARVEQTVNVVSPDRAHPGGGGTCGLRARFVRGGCP